MLGSSISTKTMSEEATLWSPSSRKRRSNVLSSRVRMKRDWSNSQATAKLTTARRTRTVSFCNRLDPNIGPSYQDVDRDEAL